MAEDVNRDSHRDMSPPSTLLLTAPGNKLSESSFPDVRLRPLAAGERPDHFAGTTDSAESVCIVEQHRVAGILQPGDQISERRLRIGHDEAFARRTLRPAERQRLAVKPRADGSVMLVAKQLVLAAPIEPAL